MGRGSLYAEVRERVTALLLTATPSDLAKDVPGTPQWTVSDLVAHLAGGAADISAGNIVGAGSDEWTQKQVEDRRDRSLADLLDEWTLCSPGVESMLDQVPQAALALADVATHEQDLAGALGLESGRTSAAYDAALQLYLGRLDERLLAASKAISIDVGSDEWVLGDGPPATQATTTTHELFRAVSGRRSILQISSWTWTGEPGGPDLIPVLPAPDKDVIE